MTQEQAQLVAQEMKLAGFESKVGNGYVRVSLNRHLSMSEVATILDQSFPDIWFDLARIKDNVIGVS